MIRLPTIFLAVVIAAGEIYAAQLGAGEGWLLFETGDHAGAEALWRELAETGDANAMSGLGHAAAVRGDEREAARWHHEAAVRGHGPSQVLIGSAYAEGRGIERDPLLAYVWYHFAALNGHAKAALARDEVGLALSPEEQALARSMVESWRNEGIPRP